MVGSIPSLTRSGRLAAELLGEPPLGQHVDRVTRQIRHRRNARLPPPLGGPIRSSGFVLPPSMAVLGLKRRRSGGGDVPPAPPAPPTAPAAPAPPGKREPRLKKLRILFVLLGLGILALVSIVFGMMAAVSQDLPAIYNFAQYKASKNSVLSTPTAKRSAR